MLSTDAAHVGEQAPRHRARRRGRAVNGSRSWRGLDHGPERRCWRTA